MGLNLQQQRVVDSNDARLLCLAGAGTGKTYSLVERVFRLVNEGVSPEAILVLTFTNAAAFEMRDRFQKRVGNGRIPEFRTFHSFCYHLMSVDTAVRTRMGYQHIPSIASDVDVKRIEVMAKEQCHIKLSATKLNGDEKLSPSEQFQRDLYKKAIKRIMRSQNVITFDSLCYDICELFVNKDPCIEYWHNKYQHIMVDEMQDTDPRQYKFVMSFDHANIMVVGDALQALYAFRGADSSIIKQLADDPTWTTIKLEQNYRSGANICKFANENSTYADNTYRVAIDPVRDTSDNVFVHNLASHAFQYSSDVDPEVLDYIIQDVSNVFDQSSAILCRTNAEVEQVCQYLRSHNVEFISGRPNKDIKHLFNAVTSNDYAMAWLATYLTADVYAEYIRLRAIADINNTPYTLKDFVDTFGKFHNVQKRVDTLMKVRQAAKEAVQHPLDTWNKVIDIVDANMQGSGKLMQVPDILSAGPVKLIEQLKSLYTVQVHESSTYVGTIHSVKGLEFDRVYLLNVDGPSFRLTGEENKNVYYVGITRARDVLHVWEYRE